MLAISVTVASCVYPSPCQNVFKREIINNIADANFFVVNHYADSCIFIGNKLCSILINRLQQMTQIVAFFILSNGIK